MSSHAQAFHNAPAIGFLQVIKKAKEWARQATTLGEVAFRLAALGGFQDPEALASSLTPVQLELISRCGNAPFSPGVNPRIDAQTWHVGLWSYGRIYLSREAPSDIRCELLGSVYVPEEIANELALQQATHDAETLRHCAEMEAAYELLGEQHLLAFARFMLDHIEPSMFFLESAVFSNFGPINNLLPRDGLDQDGYLFSDLRHQPLDLWSKEHKTLVFALYLIRRSGFRCEEFSGRQLTLPALDRWLTQKRDGYCALLNASGTATDLLSRADELFAAKQAVRKSHFTYRIVNGLNFNKREELGSRADICLAVARLPKAYADYVAKTFKVHSDRHLSIDTFAKSTIDSLIAESACSGFDENFSDLLGHLVRASTNELRSDIGMTRAPRDLLAWANALKWKDYDAICAWPSAEYFTAVYASDEYASRPEVGPKELYASLYSIAGRMTYNSWHYAPGQCPVEAVPPGRHFFFPPKMSDLGVVSNQHHGGHVLAQINHSIRSPAGISINGNKHFGLVDLRFVRCSGNPYTYKELVRSRELTALARSIYQALVNRVTDDSLPCRVEAFSKEWYARRYLSHDKPEPVALAYGT